MRLPHRAPRAGFTLMEVLLALLIMAMMLASITRMLTTVRTTRDHIHNTQETMLAGPAILDLIERDLLALTVTDLPKRSHLRVKSRVELGLDADRLDFVTTTDSKDWKREGDRFLRSDYNEVGYVARPNPEFDEFLELYRREDFGVDEEPFAGGGYVFLHDRVRSIDIQVYTEDGPDAEPLDEWGMNPDDEENVGLPASIHISITLELAPRLLREQLVRADDTQRIVTYRRIVRFPEALRKAEDELPYLAVPVPAAEVESGGAGDQLQGNAPDGPSGGPGGLGSGGPGTSGAGNGGRGRDK